MQGRHACLIVAWHQIPSPCARQQSVQPSLYAWVPACCHQLSIICPILWLRGSCESGGNRLLGLGITPPSSGASIYASPSSWHPRMCCLLGLASPLIACHLAQNQHHHPPAASRLLAPKFGPNGRQFRRNWRQFSPNLNPCCCSSHFSGRDHLRRLSHDAPDPPRVVSSAPDLVWAGRKGVAGMGRLPGKHRIGARTACAACAWSDTNVEDAAGAGGAARFGCRAPC